MKSEYLHVAFIRTAHGIKGELKLDVLSEDPNRLSSLRELFLISPKGECLGSYSFKLRDSAHEAIVKLDGIDDRDKALALRGHYLSVPRSQALVLEEGRYYVSDLLGLNVIDQIRGPIGKLKNINSNGAQDVYEIARPGMKNLYMAVHKDSFLDADLAKAEIYVKLPEGLWEVYE